VEWQLNNATIGQIIRHVVENPTGKYPTGVVCHIEEPRDSSGVPIKVAVWSGLGKTVQTMLGDFANYTGCKWGMRYVGGVRHFYFYAPANLPEWDTIQDYGEASAGYRVIEAPNGEVPCQITDAGFANVVNYPRTIVPPELPPGTRNWDEALSDDSTDWAVYDAAVVTVEDGEKAPGGGAACVRFTVTLPYSATVGSAYQNAIRGGFVDLGYLAVPGALADQSTWYWGWIAGLARARVYTDQSIAVANLPKSIVNLQLGLHSGAYPGPSLVTDSQACYVCPPSQAVGQDWTPQKWQVYGKALATTDPQTNATLFDPTNIHYWQLRAALSDPRNATALTTGHTWTLEVCIDQLHPVGTTAAEDAPTTSQGCVMAAAVEDGREQPIPMAIEEMSLPYPDSAGLAALTLAEHYRKRTSVGPLPVIGMVNPPVLSRFPVDLQSIQVTDQSYAADSITWRPFEDITEISLGDRRLEEDSATAALMRMLDRLRAKT
jgi:hypothetical protein